MLDNHGAGRGVFVAEGICLAFAKLSVVDHDTVENAHVRDFLRFAGVFRSGVQRKVDGVGDQTALLGTNGFEYAFAGEGLLLHNGETASIERQTSSISEPERSHR